MTDEGLTAADWQGEHAFGEGWFAFRGRAADNAFHAHAAVQLTASRLANVAIQTELYGVVRGSALVVGPGIHHRLLPCTEAVLVLIEPAAVAARIFRIEEAVAALDSTVANALTKDGPLGRVVFKALSLLPCEGDGDVRLQAALGMLTASRHGTLADLSRAVGLSEARLRALAKRDLGVPLTKVAGYRRLATAAEVIAEGASLADAAAAAGFADQAHLTRTFKAMVGLTPGAASTPLR